jgi:hypothetical protein
MYICAYLRSSAAGRCEQLEVRLVSRRCPWMLDVSVALIRLVPAVLPVKLEGKV